MADEKKVSKVLEGMGYKPGAPQAEAKSDLPAAEAKPDETTPPTEQPQNDPPKEAPVAEAAPVQETKAIDLSQLKEEDILKFISEKTGSQIKSFDDLKPKTVPTDEDKAQSAEKRKQDILKYALDNKLYTSKDLESYLSDKGKDARELAFEAFKAEVKEADKNAKDEDIQNMFDILYAEEADEDKGWINSRKKLELQQKADNYINSKYGNILKADSEYGKYEQSIEAAKVYTETVNNTVSQFNPLEKYVIDDGAGSKHEISYNIPQETISQTQQEFLNSDTYNLLKQGGMTPEAIAGAFKDTVLVKEMPKIIVEAARSYHSVMMQHEKMGRKNIPVNDGTAAPAEATPVKRSKILDEVLSGSKR